MYFSSKPHGAIDHSLVRIFTAFYSLLFGESQPRLTDDLPPGSAVTREDVFEPSMK